MVLTVEEVMRQKPASSNSYASRNAHPFIFRLSTEILEDIFIQCASDYHCEYRGCPTSAVPSWVNVSYVCHHWRHVALDCATMWTHIFLTSPRWTEELLARSSQASLKIRITLFDKSGSDQWLNTLEKVMDHLERIQDLCLALTQPYKQVLSKLCSPAPRLQTLYISLDHGPPLECPSLLFAGVPPALRTLNLSNYWVPLSSFKLHSLTSLGLYPVPDRFRQNIEQFLVVMGNMKKLEHLYLDGTLAGATGFLSSAVFRTFKKIDLPHLSYLRIGAPVSTTIALLSCVNIPSKTTVKLEPVAEVNIPFHNYAVLYSLFTQRCCMAENHALSSSTILSLDIEICEGGLAGTLTFTTSQRNFPAGLGEDEDEDKDKRWAFNIPLQIHFSLSEDDGDSEPFISNICSSMPLSNLRNLCIIQPPSSPTFWRNLLGHLQDIRCIKLEMANMPDLSVLSLSDLTTDDGGQHQDDDRGQSDILAPNLEELVLDWIEFLPEGDSDQPDDLGITRRSLLDALSTRQSPHGRLTMTNCTIGYCKIPDSVMVWGDGRIQPVCDSEDSEE